MAFPRIGGTGISLNLNNAIGSAQQFGAQIVGSGGFTQSQGSNIVTLAGSETFAIPAGTYLISPGPYTCLQWLDPVGINVGLNSGTNYTGAVNGLWRTINAENTQRPLTVDSDGGNYRLANLTGCAVGAVITNAGSGFTAATAIGSTAAGGFVVTPTAGGSQWVPIIGGAINTTVTITAGGTNYQYAPILVFSSPPAGGVQASGYCTISGGAINSVVVTNQGAGYATAPFITVINDSRDAVGSGGVLTVNATLVGLNSCTALICVNHGTSLTSTPTFNFAYGSSGGGSVAATALMNYVVTGWNAGSGATLGNAAVLWTTVLPGTPPTPASNTVNPASAYGTTTASTGGYTLGQPSMIPLRLAQIGNVTSAGGASQASSTAGWIYDAGFGYINTTGTMPVVLPQGATATPAQTPTFGSIIDTSWIQPL